MLPGFEILARPDGDIFPDLLGLIKNDNNPVLARLVPDWFPVVSIRREDRIFLVELEIFPAIDRVGDGLAPAHVRNQQKLHVFIACFPTRGVVGIHIATSGKAGADGHGWMPQVIGGAFAGTRANPALHLRPMNQVRAFGVPPIHITPGGSKRVTLPKHVIIAIRPEQAVGVIVPPGQLAEVELRA